MSKDISNIELEQTPALFKYSNRKIKNIADAQRILSRLISEFIRGNVKSTEARTLTYLLSTYVNIARDTNLEMRLEEIENKIKDQIK